VAGGPSNGQALGVPWIVDGMNLIGSRPDGWWRDRAGAQRRLVSDLARLATSDGDEVAVVFDGQGRPSAVVTGVAVTYAPGGPDAADHVIVAMVQDLDDPSSTTVVTSDGDLTRRVRAAGAGVVGVASFRRLLEGA
jgi:predicted RNA-binding protein with PIN domain